MDLVEREAFALAAISDALYLVTKRGEALQARVEPADP